MTSSWARQCAVAWCGRVDGIIAEGPNSVVLVGRDSEWAVYSTRPTDICMVRSNTLPGYYRAFKSLEEAMAAYMSAIAQEQQHAES